MHRVNKVITIGLAAATVLVWLVSVFTNLLRPLTGSGRWIMNTPALPTLCIVLPAMTGLGWVLVWLGERRRDNETRCRRCAQILRGLSEPRCPERGERI